MPVCKFYHRAFEFLGYPKRLFSPKSVSLICSRRPMRNIVHFLAMLVALLALLLIALPAKANASHACANLVSL